MDKRTAEIIMLCKGQHKYKTGDKNLCDLVATYMSDICLCPKEYYTESVLRGIIMSAVKDYLDSCDKPSVFINGVEEIWDMYNNPLMSESHHINFNEAVLRAFSWVRVKVDDRYINGFSEENTRTVIPQNNMEYYKVQGE